jgi:serine/threonine protein kinase
MTDGNTNMLGNRYLLTTDIRYGAQASVTRAFDTKLNKIVAVKRVKFGPHDERAKTSFAREATFLQDIKHKNIVEWIATDQDEDGSWYLVLEWIDDTLEDVIGRDGAVTWNGFWQRFGSGILDGLAFAQKHQVAHRDVKPKNILVDASGVPKLADYGISKLADNSSAWLPAAGMTFRFDHTPGYTPSTPEDAPYQFTRDCYAFAAVAISCVVGRVFDRQEELMIGLQEAPLPAPVRAVLERCLDSDPASRPPLASVLKDHLEQAQSNGAENTWTTINLLLAPNVKAALEKKLLTDDQAKIEAFLLEDLSETCAISSKSPAEEGSVSQLTLIGTAWRYQVSRDGKSGESLFVQRASEIGASLASDLRESALARRFQFSFGRPPDPEHAGRQLSVLLVEANAVCEEYEQERRAKATQKIFRLWRSYLRDRADHEAKRSNAIKYIDMRRTGDRVVFTTEIAHGEDLIGQDRVVQLAENRVGGKITSVAFNQISMDITFGEGSRIPRRGEIAINTIAAQKALSHQTAALDAVVFERAVSPRLKPLVLDPSTSIPIVPAELTADEREHLDGNGEPLDGEKLSILAQALGIQDVLAIEGPPGTGKTKLITEIVLTWLKRNPSDRILLSSQTHIALDNVLEKVAEAAPHLDMIRIGKADEPRISEQSRALLLSRRVDIWIAEVRKAAEHDLEAWASEVGVDKNAVAIGMKVERLIQLLKRQADLSDEVAQKKRERDGATEEGEPGSGTSQEQDEETTQLDSEIGGLQTELQGIRRQQAQIRLDLEQMGEYANALAHSEDNQELADWAVHFLNPGPLVETCRQRLSLLEDWQLRVGRSSDFNAAMLSAAQIIAGTCVGIASVQGMQDVAYDLCIIDEASKATPTEILIPMSRSKKWIVVGDPKQLPPFFEDLGESLLANFETAEVKATLLDRFLDAERGLPKGSRAILRNQYRMIKPIGDLVSECFYDKALNSPILFHPNGAKLGSAFPMPVTWYSTHNLANKREKSEGETYSNQAEINAIRVILQRLQFLAKAQKKPISVAVIAGYTGQVAALREMYSQGLGEWADLDVTCNSVDAFQGRQAEVCIYSVVRSNPKNKLGFLKEKPRLNVALSRGKSALVIVGDQLFCRSAEGVNPFRKVIDYIDANEATCATETLS